MPARLIFVHGTTVRDVGKSMAEIRKRAWEHLGLSDGDVVAAEWGLKVAPPRRNFTLALPPEYSTRSAYDQPPSQSTEAELWALLLLDPSIELQVIATERSADPGSGGISIGGLSPGDELTKKVETLDPPAAKLDEGGLTAEMFVAARRELLGDEAAMAALRLAKPKNDPDLNEALSRSLVARMLIRANPEVWATKEESGEAWDGTDDPEQLFVAAAVDAEKRAAVESAVLRQLGESTRGFDPLKRLGGRVASRVAVSRRADFMDPLAHFMHDVTFYLAHREPIQEVIVESIEAAGSSSPVIVLAHSLGGIAAVDLLSKPDAPHVDLLVTVGSQAPLLYLMDALENLTPEDKTRRPKVPWLNIYNRDDLLSFCAKQVFPEEKEDIVDFAIDAGVPFPASHSAYWHVDALFTRVGGSIEQL
jgi:hypothetical protein